MTTPTKKHVQSRMYNTDGSKMPNNDQTRRIYNLIIFSQLLWVRCQQDYHIKINSPQFNSSLLQSFLPSQNFSISKHVLSSQALWFGRQFSCF